MEVINGLVCKITENNIHIEDSYQIKSKPKMREVLYAIQHNHPEVKFNRTYKDLTNEWIAHNRLYKWNIKPEKTKDVDLGFEESWINKVIWNILGI